MKIVRNFLEEFRYIKNYNIKLLLISSLIFLIGVFNLYSATHTNPALARVWKMQIVWFSLSTVIYFIASFIRIETYKRFSYLIYGSVLVSLILVLIIGIKGMGAQRWLRIAGFRIQPSEFMKMGLILCLANWFSSTAKVKSIELKSIILPGLFTLVPMLLIVKQPDLGTSLILFFLFAAFIFTQRLSWKDISKLLLVLFLASGLMYQFGLKEYQKRRIATFINPDSDTLGASYNVIQSKIAIGSGQIFGKGFLSSSQASLYFLPENHTDFAFSVYAEEQGFFGALVLITLFAWLILELLFQANSLNSLFASLVSVGVAAFIFVHVFINMAMVMGLLPVVGLPLPYISYGGSSLLSFGLSLGIATSASRTKGMFGTS